MKKLNLVKAATCGLIGFLAVSGSFGQKKSSQNVPVKPKTIVFAVLDDGKSLEPIGEIDKGEVVATVGGDATAKDLTNFGNTYYKPKTTYSLIFGGATSGTITVNSFNPKSDCGKNIATVTTQSSKAKLKGLVMGLATNKATSTSTGMRRLPTATERAEIEGLVRAEFTSQNVSAEAIKNMHYHNLTAIDVDNDGKAEMVGSFWAANSAKERNLLFFIADKGKDGKYKLGYSEYKKVTPEEVMSGDLKALDNGVYNELFLDELEYNGDKTAKIFTVVQGFEGNGFNVYSLKDGKWTRVFEGSNYHCAF